MKKGQRVLVWSLQSFSGGGFLRGEPAFLAQSTTDGGSLILCVMRKKNGNLVLDDSYEVYQEQVRVVGKENWPASCRLRKIRKAYLKSCVD